MLIDLIIYLISYIVKAWKRNKNEHKLTFAIIALHVQVGLLTPDILTY